MKIAFTICTNSFLSMARTTAASFLKFNKGYSFFIGLIDHPEDKIGPWYEGYRIVRVDEIGIEYLDEMAKRYNISELSCALKSYFCQYILDSEPAVKEILYLDSDLYVYSSFYEVELLHQQYDILLTPHILNPISFDGKQPDEIAYLATGTYNGGFFSIRTSDNSRRFIAWWCERMRYHCFYKIPQGLFVDQKWLNMVPVFFEKVNIILHPGYNISYWNLHERIIEKSGNEYLVNGSFPLVFIHFSSINLKEGILFYKQQDRFTEDSLPLVKNLFMEYRAMVHKEGYELTSPIVSYYSLVFNQHTTTVLKKTMKGRLKLWIKKYLPARTRNKLRDMVRNLLDS